MGYLYLSFLWRQTLEDLSGLQQHCTGLTWGMVVDVSKSQLLLWRVCVHVCVSVCVPSGNQLRSPQQIVLADCGLGLAGLAPFAIRRKFRKLVMESLLSPREGSKPRKERVGCPLLSRL